MNKKTNEDSRSVKTFLIYTFLVLTIIFVSLTIKAVSIFNQNKFDGSDFVLAVSDENSNVVKVVGFKPDEGSMSILDIENSTLDLDMLSGELGIGYEGFLHNDSEKIGNKSVDEILSSSIFEISENRTNLTIFDKIYLLFLAKKTSTVNISIDQVSLPIEEREINRIAQSLFSDGKIRSENKSIKVINGSGVAGLANTLSRIVSNRGGNVVMIESGDTIESKSRITYISEKGYTVRKLSSLTGFIVEESDKKDIADIVMIIGKDAGAAEVGEEGDEK